MSPVSIDRYLEIARAVVAEASAMLAGVRAADIRTKSDPRDLVTEWDTRAEEVIRRELEARAPGVPIVGEEGGGQVASGAPVPAGARVPIG